MARDNPIRVRDVLRGRPGNKRRREVLTTGDRLVCGGMGALLGLALWSIFYAILLLIAFKASLKPAIAANPAADPLDLLPSYWWWGAATGDAFALFSFLAGAERMMDAFEWWTDRLGDCAVEAGRHH